METRRLDLLFQEIEEELKEPPSEKLKLICEGLPKRKTLEAIFERKSIKRFRPDPVPLETLKILVEAGLRGQSPFNTQDWHLTIVTNPEIIREIRREIDKGVKLLVHLKKLLRFVVRVLKHREVAYALEHFPVYWNAPVLIILSTSYDSYSPEHDLGYVTQNICLAALTFGLGTCVLGAMVALNRSKGVKKLIKLPKGFKAFVGIEVGYPDYQKYPSPTSRASLEEKTTWITQTELQERVG